MQDRIAEVQTALNRANLPFGARKVHPMRLDTYEFKMEKKDYNVYWDVRKGLIPIVGGARETGIDFTSSVMPLHHTEGRLCIIVQPAKVSWMYRRMLAVEHGVVYLFHVLLLPDVCSSS